MEEQKLQKIEELKLEIIDLFLQLTASNTRFKQQITSDLQSLNNLVNSLKSQLTLQS
jgi:hypothetical protein